MKTTLAIFLTAMTVVATPVMAQNAPSFGDNESDYSNDNECDDPRFVGWGVATSTSEASIGHDANDCSRLFELGQIRLNRTQDQSSTAECESINFGDDSSEWSNDSECDDPRFWGGAADNVLNFEDLGRDAKDCRALCDMGSIWLR